MKWVLQTSRIIVGTKEGRTEFTSFEDCPPEVRRLVRETLPKPESCTIMVTNREALEAMRSRAINMPRSHIRTKSTVPEAVSDNSFTLPRWQIVAGSLLGALAALTALLAWAMGSG